MGVKAEALKDRLVRARSLILFVLVVIAAVISEWDLIQDNFTKVALAALSLNLLAMTISFTISRLCPLERPAGDRDRARTRHPQCDGGHHGRRTCSMTTPS